MVRITDQNALDRMTLVEGSDWRQYQDAHQDSGYGFHVYLRAFKALQDYCAQHNCNAEDLGYLVEPAQWGLPDGDGAIYGADGVSRYVVKYDGEIVFLITFSGTKAAKAQTEGFTVG